MDTRIKSGDYTLNIDRYCMWISTQKTSEKTGKKREERVTGYYNNLGDLLEDFIRQAKADGCRTMKAAIEKLKKAEDDATKIAKEFKKCRIENLGGQDD